jgi:hypothetical protein
MCSISTNILTVLANFLAIIIQFFSKNIGHDHGNTSFKADTHSEVCVILRVPALPADNPQQSEEALHMGGNANISQRRVGRMK